LVNDPVHGGMTTVAPARLSWMVHAASGIAVGLAGVTVLFWPIIQPQGLGKLWGDSFDPRLVYWIAEWGYHALFELKDPAALWNANSFYPHRLTLAYSESFLGLQVVYGPLRLLGFSPLPALYASLASIGVLASLLSALALARLREFAFWETLTVLVASHFALPMTAFLAHYQLFAFELGPPFLLYWIVYIRDQRWQDLAKCCGIFCFAVGLAAYFAPMMAVVALAVALPRLTGLIRGMTVKSTAVLACAAVMIFFVQLRPYLELHMRFGPPAVADSATYSAKPWSIITGKPLSTRGYAPSGYAKHGDWERTLFPGYALLAGGAAFVACALRRGWRTLRSQRGDVLLAAVVLFFVVWILSWGPFFARAPAVKLPFYFLSIVPGLGSIRAPGRFGMLLGLPLAVFTIHALRDLVPSARVRAMVGFVVLAIVAIESWPQFGLHPFPFARERYEPVKALIGPGTPLLELPVVRSDHFKTIGNVMDQLDGSTVHWARLVVGYGARTTETFAQLVDVDGRLQRGEADVSELVRFARGLGIRHMWIHLDRYSESVAQRFRQAFGTGTLPKPIYLEGGSAWVVWVEDKP
jgi:hypothetical protein